MSDKEKKSQKMYEDRILADPFTKVVAEVYFLRDYYVQEALVK